MTAILSKPAGEIDFSDVESLIDLQVPESDQIEFKRTLPAEKGTVDPWMEGKSKIGKEAKNKILEEVTAFANAYGGALVLGIEESDTKPAVAAEVLSLPQCSELADRFKLVFRDCVEPQLPQLEIFAVPEKAGSDKGVVVFRVGKSRLAPHRVTSTLSCPIRRLDRCEKMTMREIQDMTLNVNRGLALLDKRLKERSDRFQKECKALDIDKACGVRLTAMPVGGDIQDAPLFDQGKCNENLYIPWCGVFWQKRFHLGNLVFDAHFRPKDSDWRPRLRCAQAEALTGETKIYAEIHWDGLLELRCVFDPSFEFKVSAVVPLDWLFSLFATLVTWADRVREEIGVPAAEYALDAEIYSKDILPLFLGIDPPKRVHDLLRKELKSGFTPFPRYSLGNSDERRKLLALFMQDCWNLGGESDEIKEEDLEIIQENEE